jgi:hypothetical protein
MRLAEQVSRLKIEKPEEFDLIGFFDQEISNGEVTS